MADAEAATPEPRPLWPQQLANICDYKAISILEKGQYYAHNMQVAAIFFSRRGGGLVGNTPCPGPVPASQDAAVVVNRTRW
jgi:hypothetical protein